MSLHRPSRQRPLRQIQSRPKLRRSSTRQTRPTLSRHPGFKDPTNRPRTYYREHHSRLLRQTKSRRGDSTLTDARTIFIPLGYCFLVLLTDASRHLYTLHFERCAMIHTNDRHTLPARFQLSCVRHEPALHSDEYPQDFPVNTLCNLMLHFVTRMAQAFEPVSVKATSLNSDTSDAQWAM